VPAGGPLGVDRAAGRGGRCPFRPGDRAPEASDDGAPRRLPGPLLVNTVVGFIGPEYLYDGKQVIRAGLEDHFCGKLLGLPMGVDVRYTNHAEVDGDDTDTLTLLLGAAGCAFVIAVPGSDDVMLHYQSLSFTDVLTARQVLDLRPAPSLR
jgi:ethanolamine ammonia-lyase large subunit